MTDRSVSRRQFLGTAGAFAATSLAASDPFPTDPAPDAAPPHFPTTFPPEPLPPGVARQFGSARFRDFYANRYEVSPDSRWVVWLQDGWCGGYELATARRVRFRTQPESGWREVLEGVTATGRLIVTEKNDNAFRVRQYDLLTGAPDPPVDVADGEVRAVSADGRLAVVEKETAERVEYKGVELATGRALWTIVRRTPLPSMGMRVVGRFAHAGFTFPPDGGNGSDSRSVLLNIDTGREIPIEPPGEGARGVLSSRVWGSADRRRLLAVCQTHDPDIDRAVVWNTVSGRVVSSFALPGADRAFGGTPDGRSFYGTVGDDHQLVLRDAATGKITRRYDVFDVNASDSAVTPDGKTLLLARTDRSRYDSRSGPDNTLIRLIDADSGLTLPQSPDPPGPLVRVWFPAATTVATAYRTKAEHVDYTLWDIPTTRSRRVVDPTERNEARQRDEMEPANLVSPDGRHTLRADGSRLAVVDTATGRTTAVIAQPPVAAGRWFWLDAATVGVFVSDGLTVWAPEADTLRVVPLDLPGKRPMVWRWRAAADGKRVGFQFFPDLAALVFQFGWVTVDGGEVTVAEQQHRGRGVGLAGSADGGRVAVGLDRPKSADRRASLEADWIAVHDRTGLQWLVNTPAAVPPFDLTGCGRTLAVRSSGVSIDDMPPPAPALELWEVVSGQRRRRYPLDALPDDLRCSPCGRWVATVRQDQPLYLWDVYGEASDPQPEPTPAELPRLWNDLSSADGEAAFRTVRTLVQHPAAAARLLGAKLKPAKAPKEDWVVERIDRLSDPDFRTRDRAERELAAVADVVADTLRKATEAGAETEEAADRLDRLLIRAAGTPLDIVRTVRAVEVLEHAAGDDARALLARLADGAPAAALTREATAALKRRQARPPS